MQQTSGSTPFSVSIVARPAVRVAGLMARTNMAKAGHDCSALWYEQFAPRMDELCPGGGCESYGISWLVDMEAGTFDYCAALPLAEGLAPPAGMHMAELPAGLYAECTVPSLAELSGAYEFVCSQWLPGQKAYTFVEQAPCYELYPADYQENGRLLLYFPVTPQQTL